MAKSSKGPSKPSASNAQNRHSDGRFGDAPPAIGSLSHTPRPYRHNAPTLAGRREASRLRYDS